jgi:glycosyltransferase involved in cell wall biosynthesis
MRIGFIPGALDTLCGEHFPHLVHMQENVEALRKKAEISVLTANEAKAWYMRFQKSGLHKILDRKYMHVIRKLLNFVFFLAVYMELKKDINHQQSDIFLVRFCHSNYFIARYLHSRGCKILLEVHRLAHVEEKEYGQSYAPPFYFVITRYLEKEILRRADRITTVSESLKKTLADFGIGVERIHAIPNAVDPDKFKSTTNPNAIIEQYKLEDKIVVGFVGSFARYHGLEILLDIAETVQNKYENIIFLLVGKNVHGSDNAMAKVSARRLSQLFTFTGEVCHSRIPFYIAAMDMAIIPDFNTYGSPMKLFEYMAMGKAIVTPDVPPIREVIEDGQTGILFEKGNVVEAARAIEKLIENEQLRYELGERARLKVIGSYTWDGNAAKIVEIAERMI